MVEFALLFALGFLAASLMALLLAPAIHNRIVRYTERRLRATVPMNPAELRAARDMDRARFAVENARVGVDLRREREARTNLEVRTEALSTALARLRGENIDLSQQIETMIIEAGDARARLRREEQRAMDMQMSVAEADRMLAARSRRVEDLEKDLRRRSMDVEDLTIDIAARETEVESLKTTIEMMTDERRKLRDEAKTLKTKASDLEFRFNRESERSKALEDKLATAVATLSDRDEALTRKSAELDRLRKGSGNAKDRKRKTGPLAAAQALPSAEPVAAVTLADDLQALAPVEAPVEPHVLSDDQERSVQQRIDKLRARHTALVDRLKNARDSRHDTALRREIRDIAATVVAITAKREGPMSPIHAILDDEPADRSDSASLAGRSRALMSEN
jgi:DNA repair exonuclease SbcCD ATPase subunit